MYITKCLILNMYNICKNKKEKIFYFLESPFFQWQLFVLIVQ